MEKYEIFEWGHIKELKATSLLKKKKFKECYDVLVEILSGIIEIDISEDEIVNFIDFFFIKSLKILICSILLIFIKFFSLKFLRTNFFSF